MKVIQPLVVVCGIVISLIACSKSNETKEEQKQPVLSSSEKRAVVNTPVTFSLQNPNPGAIAKWSVNSYLVTIDSVYSRHQSTMIFAAPGVYTIDVALKKVMCSLEAAANPGLDTCFNSGKSVNAMTHTIVVTE